jgi:hypothetical protein
MSTADEKQTVDEFLTVLGVKHHFARHSAITSVQDALEKGVPTQLGIPLGNVVKNLVLRDTSHKLYLLVTAGLARVNLHKLSRTLGVSHLSMARLDEAHGMFGTHKGTVSLFDVLALEGARQPVALSVVVDAAVSEIEGEIAFPAGSGEESVLFAAADLGKVAHEIGSRASVSMRFETL